MIVGAARNNSITVFGDAGGERLSVNYYLSLVFAELRLQRFVETNRFCRDDVHERAPLHAWKNRGVDLLGEFFFAHDDAAAGAAQAFVRRGRYKMRVRNRTGMLTSC